MKYFRALKAYAPAPYRSPAVVFVERRRPEQERFWLTILTGNVEVHRLPASHRDVIAGSHVDVWAERLRERLQRLDAQSRPPRTTSAVVGGDDAAAV